MIITDIQWHTYRLPFADSFTTAHGVMATREGAVITATTEQGITGIGEMAPLPEFGGGNLAVACAALSKMVVYLRGRTLDETLAQIQVEGTGRPQGSPLPYHVTKGDKTVYGRGDPCGRPAHCGLEIALLDALGKTRGCSVATLLSTNASFPHSEPSSTSVEARCIAPKDGGRGATMLPRLTVPVNAVVGAKSTRAAVAAALKAKHESFGCVKLKVGSMGAIQQEVERVAAVRAAIGPEMHLRLDANEAWSLEDAITILSECVPYDIQYVEQPVKRDDLAAMHTLRQTVPILIAADEALHDLHSARRILDSEAADVLIVKPQLAGGLRIGQQIIREAAERGVQSVITTTIESGISLTAALHLAAASPAITLECGLATRHLLVDDLICEDLPILNGFLAVPTGPGLGITLDKDALDKYRS